MKTSGTILEVMAWVVFIGSLIAGAITLSTTRGEFGLAIGYVAGGLISGALLFGIGNAFFFIEDMAIDIRLSRESLERLTARRQGQQPPVTTPKP